jgi:hypothetical protein
VECCIENYSPAIPPFLELRFSGRVGLYWAPIGLAALFTRGENKGILFGRY